MSGKISAALVTTKANVAAIKSVGILRLELVALLLGVRFAETVSEKLEIPLNEHTQWTDSMDVICWVQGYSRRPKSFVANRVREEPVLQNGGTYLVRDMSAESRWF